jgi:hypothetical protein
MTLEAQKGRLMNSAWYIWLFDKAGNASETKGLIQAGICLFFLLMSLCVSDSAALPAGFKSEVMASGRDLVTLKFAPDGRLFLTEKKGLIRIMKDGKLLDAPFIDISAKTDATMEKGMTGLAIDPDFLENKFIYAFYIDKNHSGYVSRWTANGDIAIPGSEKMIFDAGESGGGDFHHGGDISFGGDGKIYLTRGNRQDIANSREQTSLFGKILRFNKDGTIPEDNPRYLENQGNARAVYAWGLRNPQSLSVQPITGRMHFVDVADGTADDEINLLKKGAHYNAYGGGTENPLIRKGGGGSALMGGVFYNRRQPSHTLSFPAEYHGKCFWGQFGGAGIRILDFANGNKVSSFDDAIEQPINFDLAPDGSLWLVTRSTQVFDNKGQVIRIRYPAGEGTTRMESRSQKSKSPGTRLSLSQGGLQIRLYHEGRQTHALINLKGERFKADQSKDFQLLR